MNRKTRLIKYLDFDNLVGQNILKEWHSDFKKQADTESKANKEDRFNKNQASMSDNIQNLKNRTKKIVLTSANIDSGKINFIFW